jgi:hypothetical protein
MEINTGNEMAVDQPRAGLSTRSGILIGIGIGVALSFLCLAIIAGSIWANNTDMTADCKKRGSSIGDTLRVQMFAPGVFERAVWKESFSSSPERVTKTWFSSDLGAVSYLEYLVYNCGYSQTDMETYYSDENFKKNIFQNYEDVKKTAECSQNGLQHFEFTGSYKETKYILYYWVKQESDSRILGLMMAFPTPQEDALKKYARRVYSELATCE